MRIGALPVLLPHVLEALPGLVGAQSDFGRLMSREEVGTLEEFGANGLAEPSQLYRFEDLGVFGLAHASCTATPISQAGRFSPHVREVAVDMPASPARDAARQPTRLNEDGAPGSAAPQWSGLRLKEPTDVSRAVVSPASNTQPLGSPMGDDAQAGVTSDVENPTPLSRSGARSLPVASNSSAPQLPTLVVRLAGQDLGLTVGTGGMSYVAQAELSRRLKTTACLLGFNLSEIVVDGLELSLPLTHQPERSTPCRHTP